MSPLYLIQGGLGWLLVFFQLPVAGGATQLHLHLVLEKSRQRGMRICFRAVSRWLLQETLLPSVRWILATWSPPLECQRQSQVPLTGDPGLASSRV